MKKYSPHQASFCALDANVLCLIMYLVAAIFRNSNNYSLLAWVVPVIILFVEKDSSFIKFHAAQILGLQVFWFIVGLVLGILAIPLIFFVGLLILIGYVIYFASIGLYLYLGYIAYTSYSTYQVPVIGKFVSELVKE